MAYERKDKLYERAKEEGMRSRAAYKLQELNKKHGLIKPGSRVLDLGAWPGGWLQVASRIAGPNGRVAGIDLQPIEPLNLGNVKTYVGDVADSELLSAAVEEAGGKFDVVLSDMAPKLSGIRERDEALAVHLANLALSAAQQVLRSEGSVAIKVFKGAETDSFVKSLRPFFRRVVREELKSTRKTSNEYYVVALQFSQSSQA